MRQIWGGRNVARAGVLAVVAVLTACGGERARESTTRTLPIASFTGEVDPATGTITITPVDGDPVPAGLVYFTGYQQIPVVRNATWGNPGAGKVEVRNASGPPPETLTDGCGPGNDSFEGRVEIHSGSRLRNVYVELAYISQPLHGSCKSWPAPGLNAGISTATGGLFKYGDIARDGSATALWSFQLPGGDTTPFTFQGRIMAEFAEEDAPVTSARLVTTGPLPNNALELSCTDGAGSGCGDRWFSVDGAATTAYVGPIRLSGTQTVCFRSEDVAGNMEATRCAPFTVTGALQERAEYASSLGALQCTTLTQDCHTGDYVLGVGNATGGAEPNEPNTLDACLDKVLFPYGDAESVDRFHVATVYGGPLMSGASVRVTADVVGYNGDTLDVFTATTTVSPAWEWVEAARTVFPSDGPQTLVTPPFTLPAGAVAIRVVATDVPTYVNGCGTASNADMDDVAIVLNDSPVGPASPTGVEIRSPANGATVSRTVRVVAAAGDDVAVVRAELFVNSARTGGGFVSRGVDVSPPWVFAWDTTRDYQTALVYVEVMDAEGNRSQSPTMTVTVADETPPNATLTAPVAGSYAVGSPILLQVDALDTQSTMWQVEWFADGVSIGAQSVPVGGGGNVYEQTWTPGAAWAGSQGTVHSIWARARDVDGNYAQTAPVTVTITP